MKLFPIDTFVGENFLAGETLAASLPLIRPIDLNINSCLLYDSCIIPGGGGAARRVRRQIGWLLDRGEEGRRGLFVGAAALFSYRFMIFAASWQELV